MIAARGFPRACLLLSLGVVPASASGPIPEGFASRASKHFEIHYNTPYERVRPLTSRLDSTFTFVEGFCRRADLETRKPDGRLPIVLFARHEEYLAFLRQGGLDLPQSAGVYDPARNLSAFCDAADTPMMRPLVDQIERVRGELERARDPSRRRTLGHQLAGLRAGQAVLTRRFNRMVVQHEAAHQALFNFGVHVAGRINPAFLVEGLACQFEVPQTRGPALFPRVNQVRLGDLREALGVEPGASAMTESAYRDALASGRVVSLRALVSDDAVFSESQHAAYRYAQAWALVYDLSKRPEAFCAFMRDWSASVEDDSARGVDRWSAFEARFGRCDGQWEFAWVLRTLGLRYDPAAAGR